jgi:hypothetical protein
MKRTLTALLLLSAVVANAQEIVLQPTLLSVIQMKDEEGSSDIYLVPMIPIVVGDYYGEVRYNYDFEYTVGAYAGKTYRPLQNKKHNITPQVGLLAGKVNGASIQVYYSYETSKVSLSFQNQYSMPFKTNEDVCPYYYNWSSLGYNFSRKVTAGLSAQLYLSDITNYVDGGWYISFRHKSISMFLFDFNAYQSDKHFIALGIQKTLQISK